MSLPRIDTRYTSQWADMIEKFIKESGRQDEIVLLENKDKYLVAPNSFLNYRDYFSYIFPFMVSVIKVVKDGDTVFFLDGETAGMEAFEYLRKMENKNITLKAIWHAGTYDKNDLTSYAGVKGKNFELGWFDILDKIYVGSNYHKQLLIDTRFVDKSKIEVTGLPIDFENILDGREMKKIHDVIFTGRLGVDKGYDLVKKLREEKGLDIIATMEKGYSKKEYYKVLAESKLMFSPSRHELFGIGVAEAMASNVPVLVPNDMPVYKEIVPVGYRYDSLDLVDWDKKLNMWREKADLRKYVSHYSYKDIFSRWFT